MKTALERFIKQVIKDNCKSGEYAQKFGEDMQEKIKENSEVIAKITLEDDEFNKMVNESIEESIRIMVLRNQI